MEMWTTHIGTRPRSILAVQATSPCTATPRIWKPISADLAKSITRRPDTNLDKSSGRVYVPPHVFQLADRRCDNSRTRADRADDGRFRPALPTYRQPLRGALCGHRNGCV